MNRTRPGDFDFFECYLEMTRTKLIAANLLTFGARHFKSSSIIARLGEIENYYKCKDKSIYGFGQKFNDVLFNSSIDDIRISICYENYFKAKLLLNGFIIHKINHNKLKILSNEQKLRPIDVKEIVAQLTYPHNFDVLKQVLTESTLDYSTLLSQQAYFRHFYIDDDVIKFLDKLRKKRNRLHLLISERFEISFKRIEDYKKLNNIVDFDIAFLQNTMINELDPNSKSKLSFKGKV
ncbi:MAG: hypothetical protein JST75_17275 [Bacteroidetes bacterium]|nr:hypothetical protein [Bacteroidota bacterium]